MLLYKTFHDFILLLYNIFIIVKS